MTAQARLAVRLMDRTRRIDEFEMATMTYDPAVMMLEAAIAADALTARIPGAPDARAISAAAIALVHEQVLEEGFSVRTRLLKDNWLLYVRIDQRTGPVVVHRARPVPMLLAA